MDSRSSASGSTIASGSGSGSGSGLYSVSLFPLRARTMETPFLALAHRDAAAEGAGASAAAAAASAAAFAASASMDAGMRKSSGTGSAVSGLDPNAVAVFTNLPAFFHSAPMSFLGAAAAASPSAGASAAAPNARPPGTPFAPVTRIALTCRRVAFFHFASLSTGAAAASPPSAGAASSAGGASSGGASTGASPSASAIAPIRNARVVMSRTIRAISEIGLPSSPKVVARIRHAFPRSPLQMRRESRKKTHFFFGRSKKNA